MRIELKAASSGQPGYGELVVRGWSFDAVACDLCVQRNQGDYLGDDECWGNSPVWHQIGKLREDSEAFLVDVGPKLVDPLVGSQRLSNYRVTLRTAQNNEVTGPLKIVGALLSSKAAGNSRVDEKKVDHATTIPAPQVEAVAEPSSETVVTQLPVAEPSAKKKSSLPLLLLIGLLLALAAGLLFWKFGLKSDEAETTAEQTAAREAAPEEPASPPESSPTPGVEAPQVADRPAAPTADAPACSAAALGGTADDLVFIQSCIKSQPATQQVLDAIAAARKAGRCNVMQRLYAHKAQAGDAAIAYAYAREYDPQHFAGGACIKAAEPETAAYWYGVAVEHDPQNNEAQQRLKELSQ